MSSKPVSQDGPPSPVQPQTMTSATNEMARLPRLSIFETSFLGHSRLRQAQLRSERIFNAPYPQDFSGHGTVDQAPIQLPPPEASVSPEIVETNHSRDRMSIGRIVSGGPDVRSIAKSQVLPLSTNKAQAEHVAKTYTSYHSSLGNDSPTTSTHYGRGPPCLQANAFSTDRSPKRPHQRSPPTVEQPRHKSARSGPGQIDQSPTSVVHSATSSYYSDSSEPSPTALSALSSTHSPAPPVSTLPPLTYNLSVRQQPIAARACGFGERDRRVVDPPPILELKIADAQTGAPEQDPNAMLALHCTLLMADADEEAREADIAPVDGVPARRLMGTTVASPYQAKDENSVAGTFFVFSDLSCRTPGRYRLQFKLLRVDPMLMMPGVKHGTVASIETDIFSVYTAKEFPGMRASTALLTALRAQGLNVGLKKGTEAKVTKGSKRKESESSEDGGRSEDSAERRPGDGSMILGVH